MARSTPTIYGSETNLFRLVDRQTLRRAIVPGKRRIVRRPYRSGDRVYGRWGADGSFAGTREELRRRVAGHVADRINDALCKVLGRQFPGIDTWALDTRGDGLYSQLVMSATEHFFADLRCDSYIEAASVIVGLRRREIEDAWNRIKRETMEGSV